jgi:alcohol dehydrogenase class IV
VPRLRTFGIEEKDVPVIVGEAAKASSMKANPIVLTDEELAELLIRAI